ncbi:YccT family protein [Vibrio salinus]|uniref:YccT family protein n=1 Tax=Vibrio salinus TaxID=2899784 RepID=UPI001E4142CF|nr:DUF2057 domain-containing protein [Vibrio salinus]MCE0492830.1 DUF2057 domain-containing protein [Vibrio salinus]
MKLKTAVVSSFIGILFSLGAHAATVTAVDGLQLLAIDGNEIEQSTFNEVKSVDVNGGTHQVVFRYYKSLRKGGINQIFSTQPYIFSIDLKDNDQLKILVPKLSAYSQARAYFHRKVDWKVSLNSGDAQSVDAVKLAGQGIMPFADIEKVVADYNTKQGNEFAPVQQAAPSIANQKIHTNPADDSLVQTVQMLYQNASAEQKKRIRMWIAAQD